MFRIAGTSLQIELSDRVRVLTSMSTLVLQLAIYYVLWSALYADGAKTVGIGEREATTYVMLVVILNRVRGNSRSYSWDSVLALLRTGAILYWLLRPMKPSRYYALRAAGEIVLGASTAVVAYVIMWAFSLVKDPPTGPMLAWTVLSVVLGQFVLYQLSLILDLVCFWNMTNDYAIRVVGFLQDLLAGAIVPLWFLPAWFVGLTRWLPFQATLHVPVSIYVGAFTERAAGAAVAIQFAWCLGLFFLTRVGWKHALARLQVQGG